MEDIEPTFTATLDGYIIEGLTEGTMRVSDELMPTVMTMSYDGELYPYQVVAACIDVGVTPKQWLCAVREMY